MYHLTLFANSSSNRIYNFSSSVFPFQSVIFFSPVVEQQWKLLFTVWSIKKYTRVYRDHPFNLFPNCVIRVRRGLNVQGNLIIRFLSFFPLRLSSSLETMRWPNSPSRYLRDFREFTCRVTGNSGMLREMLCDPRTRVRRSAVAALSTRNTFVAVWQPRIDRRELSW